MKTTEQFDRTDIRKANAEASPSATYHHTEHAAHASCVCFDCEKVESGAPTAATVTFTDAPYVRSTGRKPRGRGAWAFQASRSRTGFASELYGPVFLTTASVSLDEAKLDARRSGFFSDGDVVAVLS